ncbi:MAG: hypothetical protein H8E39_03060 [Alphaproteobacteria bacterium]|nr:hypothetical protein [Alphaproteobacteria bacterium]
MDKFIARISLLVLVLAIATAQPSMAAMDCVAETPLPNNLAMTQPASDVPQALARYVGTWVGAWQDRGGDALCHRLVITSIDAAGRAYGIYSYGTYAGWNISRSNFFKVQGDIFDQKLVLVQFPSGNQARYWFSGDNLHGLYETSRGQTSDIVLTRQH